MGSDPKRNNIIAPPKIGSYPPALPTPSPSTDGGSNDRFYLPRRELCDFYISRFLEDVHCTYWFYSIETFLFRVDSTYSGKAGLPSSSWMCSLYAIFAIGSANYETPNGQSPLPDGSPAAFEERTSADYIALAKQLVPAVYDEADIDSIRALAILVRFFLASHQHWLIWYRALPWKTYVRESARICTWVRVFKWHTRLVFIEIKHPTLGPPWNGNRIAGSGGHCSL